MNTPSSVAWSCMRARSPRIAPPLKGLLGSIADTHLVAGAADQADQLVGQRRLARAGRAIIDRVGAARAQVQAAHGLGGRVAAGLDGEISLAIAARSPRRAASTARIVERAVRRSPR